MNAAANPPHQRHDHMAGNHHQAHGGDMHHAGPIYVRLAVMTLLSFVAMYALMFAMVDTFDHVHHSVNQVYMAALMAAPMPILELALMWRMYPSQRANLALLAASVVLGVACWAAIRTQAGVSDGQFVRSMIPHHAGAILMCEENRLESGELQALCRQIIRSQRAEIATMEAFRRQREGD